ncbi:MAG TPA: hypothetical protein PLM75_09930 [bacterium]|nr:hypothetical protein [bacterium]
MKSKVLSFPLMIILGIGLFFSSKWIGSKFISFQLETVSIDNEGKNEEDEDIRKSLEGEGSEQANIILTVTAKNTEIKEYRSSRSKTIVLVYENEILKTIDYFKGWFRVITTSGEVGWINEKNVEHKKTQVPEGVFPTEIASFSPSALKSEIAKKRRTGLPIIIAKSRVIPVRLGPSNFFKLIDKTYRGEVHNVYAYNDGWFEIRMQSGEFGWVKREHFDTLFFYNPNTDELQFGTQESFSKMFKPLFVLTPKANKVLKFLTGPEIDYSTIKEIKVSDKLIGYGRSGQNWFLVYDEQSRVLGWLRKDNFESVTQFKEEAHPTAAVIEEKITEEKTEETSSENQ